jgi:hypothetical protein
MEVFSMYGDAGGYETITNLDTAVGFTHSEFEPSTGEFHDIQCKAALVTVETASINFTIDGTTPTYTAGTNVGHTLVAGQSMLILGHRNIMNFLAIDAVDETHAIMKVTYYF